MQASSSISASLLMPKSRRRNTFDVEHTGRFLDDIFGDDIHVARVQSMANGVAGVLNSTTVAIAAIGRAYAELQHIKPKSGVKQIDRLLSNLGVRLDTVLPLWIRFVLGELREVVIALDWTDFDDDDHTTLCAYMVTRHGRAMPLAWRTTQKSKLKDRRTALECEFVEQLVDWIGAKVKVTVLADRAFGYTELYELLLLNGWDYVLRFRDVILVQPEGSEPHAARGLVPSNGRAVMHQNVRVTNKHTPIPAVVLVKAKRMKESWCLATSLSARSASEVVKLYGRRFTIEEAFRDTKDLHFGMGLSATHIGDAGRRDRLLLLIAMAQALLTLLGMASEAAGMDAWLKTNTVKTRTMSLYNQGRYWYGALPNMRDDWLEQLMTAYEKILRENASLGAIFALK
jgi:hypothetical protein